MEGKDDPAGRHRSTARERVLDAARTLFAGYGVSGTSLQMIADHLGVTKAAVYHQFHTKDEIVLTLLEKPIAEIDAILDQAEAMDTRERQLDTVLTGLVDVVLANPDVVGMIQGDPTVARLVQTRPEYHDTAGRIGDLLAGPQPDQTTRIAGALYGAGLLAIGHHPLLGALDPDTVRDELPRIGKRILM